MNKYNYIEKLCFGYVVIFNCLKCQKEVRTWGLTQQKALNKVEINGYWCEDCNKKLPTHQEMG